MSDDLFTGDHQDEVHDTKTEEVIGEAGRYKTVDDAAKALTEKDRYIEQLQRENAEAREAATKRANEDEFLTRMERIAKAKSPDGEAQPTERDNERSAPTLDEIETILNKREAAKQRTANLGIVESRLQETFGNDYKRRVQTQAKELGMSTSELTDIAAKNPNAFFKLIGVDGAQAQRDGFTPPPRSTIQPQVNATAGQKNYAYYQQQRAAKGEAWYFSVPVQQEIWKEVKAQGGTPDTRDGFYRR